MSEAEAEAESRAPRMRGEVRRRTGDGEEFSVDSLELFFDLLVGGLLAGVLVAVVVGDMMFGGRSRRHRQVEPI